MKKFYLFLSQRPVSLAAVFALIYTIINCFEFGYEISRYEVWDSKYQTIWLKLPSDFRFGWYAGDFNWIAFIVCGVSGFAISYLIKEWISKK